VPPVAGTFAIAVVVVVVVVVVNVVVVVYDVSLVIKFLPTCQVVDISDFFVKLFRDLDGSSGCSRGPKQRAIDSVRNFYRTLLYCFFLFHFFFFFAYCLANSKSMPRFLELTQLSPSLPMAPQ
jgi:hypothetical protein